MTFVLAILCIYLLGIVVVQARLLAVLRRLRKQIIDNGMAISIEKKGYRLTAFLDATKWPFYMFWHGLKNLVEDLK